MPKGMSNYGLCPVCGKEKKLLKRKVSAHNRPAGKDARGAVIMELCPGSGGEPWSPGRTAFRPPK